MESDGYGLRLALPRTLPAPLRQAKLWAVTRSPSLVGLLYLPVPDNPVAVARPRSAPTALRPTDPELLALGRTWLRGHDIALQPPLPWRESDPESAALLHEGEEVLAFVRAAAGGRSDALQIAHTLLADWVENNPIPSGPGWSVPTLARRLACWSAAFAECAAMLSTERRRDWLTSLHLQARFLSANLPSEREGVLALGALRALLGAGSVIAGSEPRRWHSTASRRLKAAVEQQTTEDGGHRSRRPDIHLRALGDLLDVMALLPPESRAARAAREITPAMTRFARALSHPDGLPAGFGGRGHARAPELSSVLAHSGRLDAPLPPAVTFPDAGYSAFRPCEGDAVLVDWLGPAGDADEPGAAGSYELSFAGERLVQTPARASRGELPRHSSAAADGRAFRVTREPGSRLAGALWGEGPGFAYFGIEVSRPGARLTRRMLAFSSRALAVVDRIEGSEASAESWLQLAPGVRLEEAGPRLLYLDRNGTSATLAWMPGAALSPVDSAVAGPHGEPHAAPALRLWAPGGGTRLIGYVLIAGRRRDAAIDVIEPGGERVAIRFDPRRYLLRWAGATPPRLLLAD